MLDPAELLQVNMEPRWNHLDLLRLYHVVRWADDWTGRKFGSRVHGRTPCRSRWSLPLRVEILLTSGVTTYLNLDSTQVLEIALSLSIAPFLVFLSALILVTNKIPFTFSENN